MNLKSALPGLVAVLLGSACGGGAPPPAAAAPPAEPPGGTASASTETEKPKADAAAPPPPAPGAAAAATATPDAPSKATTDDSSLMGALTKDQIRDILLKNGDLFGDCYSIGAGKSKSYVAKVIVKATIGPGGTVNAVELEKSTAKNAKVDACVLDSFKKMKFPKPKNGQAQVIKFPIEFDGVEEVKK
jgi:periplasmic protein TonB